MELLTPEAQHAKSLEFDEIAEQIFSPIYPVLAEQIVATTGIRAGCCLDIGAGGGHLGLNLALASEMSMTLLDFSMPAVAIAAQRSVGTGRADALLTWRCSCPSPGEWLHRSVCQSRFSVVLERDRVSLCRDTPGVAPRCPGLSG